MMLAQERENYSVLIEKLGGTALDVASYVSDCTHLVVGQNLQPLHTSCYVIASLIYHGSMLSLVSNAVILQCFDAVGWVNYK